MAPGRLLLPLALAGLAPGCARIEATDALVSPVVAQALYLGIDVSDWGSLDGGDLLTYSSACRVFLAYVSDPAALDEAPVEGADVAFLSEENGRIDVAEDGEGEYLVTAEQGLVYTAGDAAQVHLEVAGESAAITVQPPGPPEVDFPAEFAKDTPVSFDLGGQGYENVLGVVYEVDRSRMIWTNLPDTVGGTYAFTHPEAPVETLEIPGEAFPGRGSYVIGVAGMRAGNAGGFENVNTTLSSFLAGQFTVRFAILP